MCAVYVLEFVFVLVVSACFFLSPSVVAELLPASGGIHMSANATAGGDE